MTDLISADHLKLTLYIANKNYSSWSLRPWIAMKTKNIVFTEHLLQFDEATGHAHFIEYSPTKKSARSENRARGCRASDHLRESCHS